MTSAERSRAEFGERDVISFGKAADTDCPDNVIANDEWNATTPSGVSKVAEVGDGELLLSSGIADVSRRLALTRRGVGLVDRIVDRRKRASVGAKQRHQFAVMVDHRHSGTSSGPLQIRLHH